jgi:hypothetical protein
LQNTARWEKESQKAGKERTLPTDKKSRGA